MLIELFSLGVTAEALYERILIANERFEGGGSVSAKFLRSRGRPPRTTFARICRPVNALQICC